MNNQLTELTEKEMQVVSGGDFAYDFGFLLRELYVYATNGAQLTGGVAVAKDLGMYYRPNN